MNDKTEMQEYAQLKAALAGHLRSAQGRTWRRQTPDTGDADGAQTGEGGPASTAVGAVFVVPVVGLALILGTHLLTDGLLGAEALQHGTGMAMRAAIKPFVTAMQTLLAVVLSIHCLVKGITLFR